MSNINIQVDVKQCSGCNKLVFLFSSKDKHVDADGNITLCDAEKSPIKIVFFLKTETVVWRSDKPAKTLPVGFSLNGKQASPQSLAVYAGDMDGKFYPRVLSDPAVLSSALLSKSSQALSRFDNLEFEILQRDQKVYWYDLAVGLIDGNSVIPARCDPRLKNGGPSLGHPHK